MQTERAAYHTKQQELLAAYLEHNQGTHFTADDVREHFCKKKIPIGLATIYRHLERLVADGTLNKYIVDEHSAACFEYTGHDACAGHTQHFHLKCKQCGKLIHLECGNLNKISEHLKRSHGFVLDPFRTVFYGLCTDCAEA